jgi:hypothetical protein
MVDQLDGTSEGLSEASEATITEATSSGPEGESGVNPAWAPIREKIGDNLFQLIQPELSKWDKAAEGRISSVNGQLAEYKQLGDIPQIQQAMVLAQRIDADPATVHSVLGEFLQRTGRMPNTQEAQQIVEAAADEDAEEQQAQADPRLDAIAQQQEQMVQYLQNQQFEQEVSRETAALEQELNELRQKGYGPEDIQSIYNFTIQIAEQRHRDGNATPVSLAEGAAQFDALRTRILSAPRAGDSAPKLLPTSGGTPNGAQQRSMGQLSRQETQDLIAARLSGNRG